MAYNITLICFSILAIIWDYNYWNSQADSNYSVGNSLVFLAVWMVGANVFYSLGSGFEGVCKYHGYEFSNTTRWVILVFGFIFSVFWTTYNISKPQ